MPQGGDDFHVGEVEAHRVLLHQLLEEGVVVAETAAKKVDIRLRGEQQLRSDLRAERLRHLEHLFGGGERVEA
eukprot:CAMPEP_0184381046 /NCGR_PEP_ID=MMETSP0007-20130409/5243_1 /TAXON_ID=97485 /ORGANISM="Prymnesium parvum, Strain Texoma1" /LENGTH=72 /DNA_ID=CAMNT_0026726535 /DNA_START=999 /DNA_END=1217 /DNA_ORIENTATION=-